MKIEITLSNDGYGLEPGNELDSVHAAFQDYLCDFVAAAYPDADVTIDGDGIGETRFWSDADADMTGMLRELFDEAWGAWSQFGWNEWSHIQTIKTRAINNMAREMMTSGFTLTHKQADDLGDEAMDWVRTRLGLTVTETDSCVECRPQG